MEKYDLAILAFVGRIVAMSVHAWINFFLALAGALVALGAANRMSIETERTIILAFVTLGAGLLGGCMSYFMPERWQLGFDTLLYGGVLALLVGTRRRTIWLDPRWMPVVSVWSTILTWAVFFGTVHG